MFFVEYGEAFRILRDLMPLSAAGNGQFVLVSGALGGGKTRLLHEFWKSASEHDALVLWAAGSRAEQGLPMGVVDQLIHHADLPNDLTDGISRLIGRSFQEFSAPAFDSPAELPALREICQMLLELCTERHVVICVDDLQFVDPASLQVLLYLQHRMRSRRLLVILSEWEYPWVAQPPCRAEVTRQPHLRIQLKLMTEEKIRSLLATITDPSTTAWLARRLHHLSGGNPTLVNALVEDLQLATEHEGAPGPGGGKRFGRAVVTCLHRWEPQMFDVACGIAVLGEHASPSRLSRLLDLDVAQVGHSIEVLTRAGLVRADRLGSCEVASVILAGMSAEERSAMHLGAAGLLYDAGEDAADVAAHLLAAARADGDWAPRVLSEAAERALGKGDSTTALSCLGLALDAADDTDQRRVVLRQLFKLTLQTNPTAALSFLSLLREALRAGRLVDRDVVSLVRLLVSRGDADGAVSVMEDAMTSGIALGQEARLELELTFRRWYGAACPPFLTSDSLRAWYTKASDIGAPRLDTGQIFARVWVRGGDEESAEAAEQVLRQSRLGVRPLETMSAAILALAYGGRCDRALSWCDELIEHFGDRGATACLAEMQAVRADVCLRSGDSDAAIELAQNAVTLLRNEGWGLLVGYPLSVLIEANLELGRVREAVDNAARPIPEAMLETAVGVRYAHALGRLAMASGRITEALDYFHACRHRLDVWNVQMGGPVPLPASTAEALLIRGDRTGAREVLQDWLEQPACRDGRTAGMALRLLAATAEQDERVRLLLRAVDRLRAAGDSVELLRAERELQHTYDGVGQRFEPGDDMRPGRPERVPDPAGSNSVGDLEELSEAELRVARLAAMGRSNRDISRELWITVSTVEQHLTRVYRKLRISGRSKLSKLFAPMAMCGPQ
ncbi:helix-turn-helix transcriptional regulator [Streptomyces xylophagus]|uniref:helix-turn-helix transcriptional regulator n=1 Tax=Streptomyces xylophagus TaxID=285514 RepID=UPI000998B73C|nr:AAA family ATPase [Streptomyces xylophagus]